MVDSLLPKRRGTLRRSRSVVIICALAFWPGGARGMRAQTSRPVAFDAVSVKLNPRRAGIRGHGFPGDRFEAANVPLRDLILIAYGEPGRLLPESQLSGGPSWIDVDRFDISATAGGAPPSSVARKQMMLRTLLAERFSLAVHTATQDRPISALVLARKDGALGPQLHHANVECEPLLAQQPGQRERCILYALPSGMLLVRGQTMGAVAYVLTRLLGRAVSDRTGLVGGFDADAQFNPDGLPGMAAASAEDRARDDRPSLGTALREQLGLALESTRGPVNTLVIDHVEHPTEN
jgi:uncharacterized protein (TIGR03435 family)